MVPTQYSCKEHLSKQKDIYSVIEGPSDDVKKFLFYSENVATCGVVSNDRAAGLIGHLAGKAFKLYNEKFVNVAELLHTAKAYDSVKQAFVFQFGKPEPSKEKTQEAVLCSLDVAGVPSFFREMDFWIEKAGFNENA